MAKVTDEDVLLSLPERTALYRTVNRAQNQTRPQIPTNLSDLEIHHSYTVTLNGNIFLQLFHRGAHETVSFVIL